MRTAEAYEFHIHWSTEFLHADIRGGSRGDEQRRNNAYRGWVLCCEFIHSRQMLFHTRVVAEGEAEWCARPPLMRGKITLIGRLERASQSPPGGFGVGTRLRYIEEETDIPFRDL